MNETEFKKLLEQVKLTDADQFQMLIEAMQVIAADVAEQSQDSEWKRAEGFLNAAAIAVNGRMGN